MTKEEFKAAYCISEQMAERLDRMVEQERQQAISEHEAKQWNDFTPKTLPTEGSLIIVKFTPESKQDPIITRYSQITDNFLYGDLWMYYPAPYQEGGEG